MKIKINQQMEGSHPRSLETRMLVPSSFFKFQSLVFMNFINQNIVLYSDTLTGFYFAIWLCYPLCSSSFYSGPFDVDVFQSGTGPMMLMKWCSVAACVVHMLSDAHNMNMYG